MGSCEIVFILIFQFLILLIISWGGIVKFLLCVFCGIVFSSSVNAKSFNSSDLQALIDENAKGIIYIWSPNMPLTWHGRAEAKEVAKEMGVAFTELIDPHSQSRKALKENAMKVSAEKILELGVLNHYPAVVLYQNGALVKKVIHGYEDQDHLKSLILSVMEEKK